MIGGCIRCVRGKDWPTKFCRQIDANLNVIEKKPMLIPKYRSPLALV
jgi:hypothetical protein